jgi:hypothetical protein
MLRKLAGLLFVIALFSCHKSPVPIVDPTFADSLIRAYTVSQVENSVDANLAFWKKRMDSLPDNFVNAPEYAAALVAAFRVHGNIPDLRKADSLYNEVNKANKGKEAGLWRALAGMALLQHEFSRADSCLKKAQQIEGNNIPNAFLDFDISFEQGRYDHAKRLLPSLKHANRYGYLFRKSKYEHYDGSLDTSIACMKAAAAKAGNNRSLEQAALSNAADLCMHKGDPQAAYDLYLQSIRITPHDLHSITGLGWIALVHDKNDFLAERIFRFVRQHNQAPDILLKLEQLEEARGNISLQKKYAGEFAVIAGDSLYGKMYTRHLVELYNGILDQPAKAAALSLGEIENRPTAQVYAWYAWSLYRNGQVDKAWSVYKGAVSGKPLEGPELYYMGKMMEGMGKEYNAQQFFKAAWKNRYDLSPAKQKELETKF